MRKISWYPALNYNANDYHQQKYLKNSIQDGLKHFIFYRFILEMLTLELMHTENIMNILRNAAYDCRLFK